MRLNKFEIYVHNKYTFIVPAGTKSVERERERKKNWKFK